MSTDKALAVLARIASRERLAMAAASLTVPQRKVLLRVEEHLGGIRDWPAWAAEALLSQHLVYKDRFTLTLFLLANGCSPPLIAEWFLTRNSLRDHAARLHVAGIIKDHQSGKLEREGRTSYVMGATLRNGDPAPAKMRVWPVYTPNFAYEWKFQYMWEEAIEMLKRNSVAAVPKWYANKSA